MRTTAFNKIDNKFSMGRIRLIILFCNHYNIWPKFYSTVCEIYNKECKQENYGWVIKELSICGRAILNISIHEALKSIGGFKAHVLKKRFEWILEYFYFHYTSSTKVNRRYCGKIVRLSEKKIL